MSFLLTCKIIIGDFTVAYAESVEIVSTWKELSDVCTLKLPNRAVLVKESGEEEFSFEKRFQAGMPVQVWLGYDGNNELEFEGYVTQIKPATVPLVIVCEDETYKLRRQEAVSEAYTGSLLGLLRKYFPDAVISPKTPDIALSNFMLNRVTPAQLLQKVKEHYRLCAYFRRGKLFVGLPYTEFETLEPVRYHFQRNIVANSDNLSYQKAEDMKVKVKAISILPNNKRIEVTVGDKEGEERTLHTYNEKDKDKLKIWAESQLDRLKYEGYTGDFISYGVPYPKHSGAVSIYDDRYIERRNVSYVVDKVTTTWGKGGFRRKIEIGKRV